MTQSVYLDPLSSILFVSRAKFIFVAVRDPNQNKID